MSKFQIEKNIPIPKGWGEYTTLLRSMEEGDSVLLTKKQADSVRAMAYNMNCKVARRRQEDGNYRVWLVKKGQTI